MDEADSNPFAGIFSPQPYDLRNVSTQVPVQSRETQMPRVPSATASLVNSPLETPAATPSKSRRRKRDEDTQPRLGLLRLEEWKEDREYNEEPPTCLHYSIEWSAMLNGKEILRDTEPDLVLNPASYWRLSLRRRVEDLVEKELGHRNRADHTVVTVSVGRSQRKLTKRFEADIDWRVVENQLLQWSELFLSGKKLRVDITFYHVQSTSQSANATNRSSGRRGGSSTTQRMRSDRANQLQAEQDSTGEPSVWAQVYRVMRCPDSCDLGPHCWRDPTGKRHYKLYPHHLRSLIDFVREGSKLESQDDVPKDVRLQLYAEAQQKRDRGPSNSGKASTAMTPITINNHFPDPIQRGTVPNAYGELREATTVSVDDVAADSLDIPSPLDRAVRDYSDWHKSRVEDPSYKAQVDRARDVVLDQGRDLHQLHNDQDYTFLVEQDVNIGTAKRFVSGISTWAKRRKCQV